MGISIKGQTSLSDPDDTAVPDGFLRDIIEHIAAMEARLAKVAVTIGGMTIAVSGAFGRTSFEGPIVFNRVRLIGSQPIVADSVASREQDDSLIQLKDLAFRSEFRIEHSIVEHRVDISDTSFGANFSVIDSVFRDGLSLRNVRASGSLNLVSSFVGGCLRVDQAQVAGSVVLSSSTVTGWRPFGPDDDSGARRCNVSSGQSIYAVAMENIAAGGNVQITDNTLGAALSPTEALYMNRVASTGSTAIRGNDLRGRALARQGRAAVLEGLDNISRELLSLSSYEARDIFVSRNEILPAADGRQTQSPALEVRDNRATGAIEVADNRIRRPDWWIDISSNQVGGELVWRPALLPAGRGQGDNLVAMNANMVDGTLWAFAAREPQGPEAATCQDAVHQRISLSGSEATTISLNLVDGDSVCTGQPSQEETARTPIRVKFCQETAEDAIVIVDMTSVRAGTLEWNLPIQNCLYRFDAAALTFDYWGIPSQKWLEDAESQTAGEDIFIEKLQRWRQQMLPRNTETLMMLGGYLESRGRLAESLEMKREAKHFHYMEEKDDKCTMTWDLGARLAGNMASFGRWYDTDEVITCRESAKRKAIGSLLWFGGFGVKPANVVGWLALVWAIGAVAYWVTANTRLDQWTALTRQTMHRPSWAFRLFGWPFTLAHWLALLLVPRWLSLKLLESRDSKETPSDRPWFMQFDEDGRPQHFSLAIYSLDAMLPVLNLNHYDKYFPRYRVIRWVRVAQRVAGWILLSVLVASAAVL